MKKYFIALVVFVLFLGCGRVGDDSVAKSTSGAPTATSGNILFDVKSKSRLVDLNGNSYVDKGHYSMLVQSKDKNNNPIGDLTNISYELFENEAKITSDEAIVKINEDTRVTTNKILLLLDFSGSITSDCTTINQISDNKNNLCYQLIQSAKQFVDDTVNKEQTMAIYYFDQRSTIRALVTSTTGTTTDDIDLLKSGLNKLLDDPDFIDSLAGYNSTNLNGAVIEATKIACRWVDQCNYDIYKPQLNSNTESFEFASVVVFTDGRDLAKRATKSEMLNFIKKHDSLFYYAIGLGDVDKSVLTSIGRDKYIPVSQNSDLDSAFDNLSTQLQSWGNSFYKIEYCPASQEGSVNIKIKLKSNKYYGVISDTIKLPDNVDFRCDL